MVDIGHELVVRCTIQIVNIETAWVVHRLFFTQTTLQARILLNIIHVCFGLIVVPPVRTFLHLAAKWHVVLSLGMLLLKYGRNLMDRNRIGTGRRIHCQFLVAILDSSVAMNLWQALMAAADLLLV